MSSKRLLDAGLVFLVVGALGIAVREFWSGLPQMAGVPFFVPAECVSLVAYPLLVPNTPTKIVLGGELAVDCVLHAGLPDRVDDVDRAPRSTS